MAYESCVALLLLAALTAGCDQGGRSQLAARRGETGEPHDAGSSSDGGKREDDEPQPKPRTGASAMEAGSPGCIEARAAVDPTLLIDDMEDGDGVLPATGGRNAGWWVFTDKTPGSITPPADTIPIPDVIQGGRCRSTHAMHITGQGFFEWGAAIDVGFRYENGDYAAFDASAFQGIRFWARVGKS